MNCYHSPTRGKALEGFDFYNCRIRHVGKEGEGPLLITQALGLEDSGRIIYFQLDSLHGFIGDGLGGGARDAGARGVTRVDVTGVVIEKDPDG